MEVDVMNSIKYCSNCDKNVTYTINKELINEEIRGVDFKYIATIAYCNECGEEIYVSELSDDNIRKANEAYREKIGIIKINEIEEMLEMYNIGADPLSKLLEWGNKTIARYLQGLMPSKEYSDRLKELFNPIKMKQVFEKNKSNLTGVASRKLETKIKELLSLEGDRQNGEVIAEDIIRYYLSKVDEESGEVITHLKLQKLLYYTQSWYMAFNRTPLINEKFQAWVHGPVLPRIYDKFKWYGYSPIPKVMANEENICDDLTSSILEMIWTVYGKYEAKYLERLTHLEDPWRLARKNLKTDDSSNIEIKNEDILNYYSLIKEKHNINDSNSLDKYVSSFCYR
jgi:uncharacterized phage-associated protein